MTAKEYLKQIRKLDTTIKRLDQELTRARNELITLRSPWPDGQPHGSGGKSDPVGEKSAQLADLITSIEDKQLMTRARLWRIRSEIIQEIGKVGDPLLQEVLYSHYVDGKKLEDVAVDIGYSHRHTVRIHDKALQAMEVVLKTCH